MLERKPWKRPRKGKKIPREKTDRDQSEPLLLSSFQLQCNSSGHQPPKTYQGAFGRKAGSQAAGRLLGERGGPRVHPIPHRCFGGTRRATSQALARFTCMGLQTQVG